MSKIYTKNTLYFFYITFFGILAVFPVLIDYISQTYLRLGIDFIAPYPNEIFQITLFLVGAAFLASLILFLSIRKNKTQQLEYISIAILRYTIAFAMVSVYGYCKIVYKQFELRFEAMDTLLKDVVDHDLVWYFYGRSNFQTLLYGLLEFIPGLLLLFKRTTFLGAALLLPTLSVVALINIFNHIEFHTFLFSIMFVFFDIGILLFYRREIIATIVSNRNRLQSTIKSKRGKIVIIAAKSIFVFAVMLKFAEGIFFAIKYRDEKGCYGAFQLQELAYNNKIQNLDSANNYWNKIYFEKFDSRNFIRDKNERNINAAYFFNEDFDSLRMITYKESKNNENQLDTLSHFYGAFELNHMDSILVLTGEKDDTLMRAIYRQLPINGKDWWW